MLVANSFFSNFASSKKEGYTPSDLSYNINYLSYKILEYKIL